MNPHKVLEDPPRRGILNQLPLLIGKCLLTGLQGIQVVMTVERATECL
jgi:hypothetical protein